MNNGFYGSLSKIQKVNFQFDRIFPNRAMMDQEAEFGYYIAEGSSEKLPPVFNGRYVLVDYHEGDVVDKTIRIGYKSGNTVIAAPGISFGDGEGVAINDGDRITVIGEYDENENYTPYDVPRLYEYPNLQTPITYTSNTNSADSLSTYEKNLMIDGQQYGNIGRGWDSTVWQKTYQNGKSTYIMIAELNTFNPTIAIAPDAPTEIPANPYVGTDSTLDFYRIHMQPVSGIRIKSADQVWIKEENGLNVLVPHSSSNPEPPAGSKPLSEDVNSYPSDVSGDFAYFDGESSDRLGDLPLAIYYNKEGMDKHISKSDTNVNDSIKFTHTGRSGKKYFDKTTGRESYGTDTYELSILLPSLGESISKVYDLAYGENRYYNADGLRLYYNHPLESVGDGTNADFTAGYFTDDSEGIERGFRNTDIFWNSKQGVRLFKKADGEKTFDPDGLNSLAGMINTAHDLMGMIIRDYEVGENVTLQNVKAWDPTKIYFINGHYYYKTKNYTWEKYLDNEFKNSNVAYNQIHTLPSNLVNNAVGLNDPTDDNVQLTSELDPSLIYFIDTTHDGSDHQRNVLYRESWEEYPRIQDSKIYDLDKTGLFGTKYVNYIKVKDENDLIDGAVYGIIAENSQSSSSQDTPVSGRRYFYYDTSFQYGTGAYLEETGAYNKGIYYDLTDVDSNNVEQEFYIPNAFYAYNKTTHITKQANAASLYELTGNHSYTNDDEGNYLFYREVTTGSGTTVEEDPDIFDLKRQEVPVDRYLYQNSILYIYKNSQKIEIVEQIGFKSADDVTNKEQVDTIEFDLNSIPVYYWTKQYTNSNKINYYTKDELNSLGLDPEEYNIAKHKMKETSENSPGNIIIPDPNSLISSLIDFEEGKYFYFFSNNILILETFNRLRTSEGRERSKNHLYYNINLPSVKKIFQGEGGSYYKTKDGDYILYPSLHINDPNEDDLVGENKPLHGEVKQQSMPNFIPLGDINNFRIFKPDTYYTTPGGLLATELIIDNQHEYYERVGNIVGDSEPDYPDGLEWEQPEVPETVSLGEYHLVWEAKELKGLGEEVNTMFGLILKVNQMLEGENKNTRSSGSVQGILNQCKDTLAMIKSFGYSFNGFQIQDGDGENDGNPLIATTPGDRVKLVSNNSLVDINIANGKIRFDETMLNAENDEENEITYLNVGKVSTPNVMKPQIIEHPQDINENENISNYINNNRVTDLAFNANNISFYGPNEQQIGFKTENFDRVTWTDPENENVQWIFDAYGTYGNSLWVTTEKHFILKLHNSADNKKDVFNGYSNEWSGPIGVSTYSFSEANLTMTLNSADEDLVDVVFSLELETPLDDLPDGGVNHSVTLIKDNATIWTENTLLFENNSTVFSVSGTVAKNILSNGNIRFRIDNQDFSNNYNSEVRFNPWTTENIQIAGNNHILVLKDQNDVIYYQKNDFEFGTPNAAHVITGDFSNGRNPDGKQLGLYIDNEEVITWNNFKMPVIPSPVKRGEFKNTGELNIYKGLNVVNAPLAVTGGIRPIYEGKPFTTSGLNAPIHLVWTPEAAEIPPVLDIQENSPFIISSNGDVLVFFNSTVSQSGEDGFIRNPNLQIDNQGNFTFTGLFYPADLEAPHQFATNNLKIKISNNEVYSKDFVPVDGANSINGNILNSLSNGQIQVILNDQYTILSGSFDKLLSPRVLGTPAAFTIYNANNNTPLIKIQAEQED